jgi:hypothetical protein
MRPASCGRVAAGHHERHPWSWSIGSLTQSITNFYVINNDFVGHANVQIFAPAVRPEVPRRNGCPVWSRKREIALPIRLTEE